MKVQENDKAPAFALSNQDGKTVRLGDFKGAWLLIFFYPRDNTPGCSIEAKGMREAMRRFEAEGLHVVGISADSVVSHKKFSEKLGLTYDLLSDEDKETLRDYGVWGKKKFMGREFMGITRSSVLVDPKGRVAKVYPKVKPAVHASEVLEDIRTLKA